MSDTAGEVGEAGEVGTGGSELRRLHPLTPLVRGWKWFAGLGLVGGQQAYGDVTPRTFLLGLLLLLPVAVGFGFVSWRFTRYRIGEDDLRLETGVLFRRSRRVRLDRLQAVDVVRPLLARVLGLAELRLEVVGGGAAEAPLAYLSEDQAQRLRSELLARAAGLHAQTPEAPERVLLHVAPVRLALSALLSVPVLLGTLAVLAATAGASVRGGYLLGFGLLVPAVTLVLGPIYNQFVQHFDFTLAESPDGLRLRYGLLETRSQTVPPGRVQAVRLVRPALWRQVGWARIEVNVAGYAGQGQAQASVLLPVATLTQARAVLARVLPGVDIEALPLVGVPPRARSLDPLAWRFLAAGATPDVFVIRRGLLRRELDLVPHAKTQSVRWTQGPVQRRLRLATVHLDSTPGPVRPSAAHRDADEAMAIVEAQTARARAARAGAGPERWMASDNPDGHPATPCARRGRGRATPTD